MDAANIPVLEDTQIRRVVRCDDWLTPRRFAAILALFIFCLFPSVVFGLQTFFFRDYGIFGYPLAAYHKECFWRGELPLWNPLSNCGLPYLAQWNTLTLYPLSLIYLLLPLPWSLSFYCLVHLFLAGLGMYFLAFSWTNNRLAAAVAGFAFVFNGLMLNCLMWPNNIAGLALMPWVIWRLERSWNEGGRQLIVAGLVGALQMLSGAPEIILFTWLIGAALWAARFFATDLPRGRFIVRGAAVPLLVVALSAAQLFPFFDLLSHCERDKDFGTGTWTMPSWGWLNLFLPLFKCYQSPAGPFFQPRQGWTSSYYEGIGVLALALFSARFVRERRVTILWSFVLFGLIVALGENGIVYGLIRRIMPGLGFMRFPIKFVVLMIFALPLLAAFAIAHLRAGSQSAEDRFHPAERWALGLILVFASIIAGCLVYSYSHPFANLKFYMLSVNGAVRLSCLVLVLGTLFRLRNELRLPMQRLAQVVLLAAIGIDAWTHAPNQNPTVAPGVFELRAVARELQADAEKAPRAFMSRTTHDVLYGSMIPNSVDDFKGRRFGFFGNCNLLDGVPVPDGFYSLYLPEQRELWMRLFFATKFPGGLADFLGISRISTNVFDWQPRATAQPLISIGARPLFAERGETVRALLNPEFNSREIVYLPTEAQSLVTVTNGSSAEIVSSSMASSMVQAQTKSSEAAFVVIAQSFYHRWKATVDGQPAPILRANHAFQAVQVPSGEHRVELVYKDTPFRYGACISIVTLIACASGLVRARKGSADEQDAE